jgi:hypothetical protein
LPEDPYTIEVVIVLNDEVVDSTQWNAWIGF